jgi:hypothetical protein
MRTVRYQGSYPTALNATVTAVRNEWTDAGSRFESPRISGPFPSALYPTMSCTINPVHEPVMEPTLSWPTLKSGNDRDTSENGDGFLLRCC